MPRAGNGFRRCRFQRGQYRCPRSGVGRVPLCREHYEAVEYHGAAIRDELPGSPSGHEVGASLEDLLNHPGVQALLGMAASVLEQRARQAFNFGTPRPTYGGAFYAQWPPAEQRPPVGEQMPPIGEQRRPPPPPRARSQADMREDPRVVLGIPPSQPLTAAVIKQRRKALAAIYHPDRGGSDAAMQRINQAADALLAQLA